MPRSTRGLSWDHLQELHVRGLGFIGVGGSGFMV